MKNPFRQPTLGLTLSGGGARGGAHIGVLRVLYEIGYQPDIIVGASIGAFVAALVGAEFSLPDIERIFKQTNLTDMIRPARHGYSLLDSKGYEDSLKANFGDADLRDLSPRIGVSATDIRHKQRILLT